MSKAQNTAAVIFKVLGIVLYAILIAIFLTVNIVWIFLQRNPVEIATAEVNYVSKMADVDGTERYFLEVNYWQNDDNRGVEAYEFCMNAYTDYDFSAIKGQGIQFVNNDEKEGGLVGVNKWNKYNYARQESLAWGAMPDEQLKAGADGTEFYVDLDGEPYLVLLDGVKGVDYVTNSSKTASKVIDNMINPITAFRNIFAGKWFEAETWVVQDEIKNYFTLEEFYLEVANNLTYSNVGAGSYSMSLVEMTKYFNFYKINSATGIVSAEPCNADFKSSFFEVKVNVFSTGLRSVNDSSFGMVEKSAKWSVSGLDDETNEYSGREQVNSFYASDFVYYKYNSIDAICPVLKSDRISTNGFEVIVDIDFNDNYLRGKMSTYNILILDDFVGELDFSKIELKFTTEKDVNIYYYSQAVADKIEATNTLGFGPKIHMIKVGGQNA